MLQAFVNNGTNLALSFAADPWSELPEDRLPTKENVDFEKETGKVFFLLTRVQLYLNHENCAK